MRPSFFKIVISFLPIFFFFFFFSFYYYFLTFQSGKAFRLSLLPKKRFLLQSNGMTVKLTWNVLHMPQVWIEGRIIEKKKTKEKDFVERLPNIAFCLLMVDDRRTSAALHCFRCRRAAEWKCFIWFPFWFRKRKYMKEREREREKKTIK